MIVAHTSTHLTNYVHREIICEVIFGTPSKNCQGSGICMVAKSSFFDGRPIACKYATSFVSSPSPGILMFRFPKSSIGRWENYRLLEEEFFWVEEAFILPRWLGVKCNMTSAVVRPGKYPVIDTIDSRWIRFHLTSLTQYPSNF